MDLNTLPVLGEGRLSVVYTLEGGKILKVFRYPDCCEWEYKQSLAVWQAGVSRQRPHETLRIDGRDAIIYDYLEGRVLMDVYMEDMPRALYYIGKMAEFHANMLRGTSAMLGRVKDSLCNTISHAPYISDAQRRALLRDLEAMPDGDHVLHGDLHPMNVIISGDHMEAIDWVTASRGDPAADICRSWYLIRYAMAREDRTLLDKFFRITAVPLAGKTYLDRVTKAAGVKKAEVMRWLPFVAAGRLCEDCVQPEVKRILKIVGKWYAGVSRSGFTS